MAKTIMVVDDSASMRQVIGITLKGVGYDVIEAANGQEAIARLDGKTVNLIISDVNMPVMDGITLIKEVKKMPAYKFTPIVMLTTEGAETKKQEGRQAGAKAWVVKPFQPEQILKAVAMLV